MKQYYIRESTPLKYHTFMRYAGLPLGILIVVRNIISSWPAAGEFNYVYLIDYASYFASFVLLSAAFVGFFNWAGYAWNCMMINYVVVGLHRVVVLGLYAVYLPSQLAAEIGSLIGFSIAAVLVGIYYWKRRPLFFPPTVHFCTEREPEHLVVPANQGESLSKYCHKCGFELLRESEYCSQCGTPVLK